MNEYSSQDKSEINSSENTEVVDKKKKNIIIYNIPESSSNDPKIRLDYDLEICENYLELS